MDEKKEVKPIILTDETGAKYTLEFNRMSVKYAESKGFDIEDISKHPVTRIPELFHFAFYMHHKGISREKTDTLYENIGTLPDGFLERLIELYGIPVKTLFEGSGKNATVTVEM